MRWLAVPGSLAIGHTRYSTTGDSALLNAQPIMVECNKGKIALAHNGNITNALEIRGQLEQQGSIFQTTSDTEVIVHLIARSREQTLADAMADSLRRIEGAFSLVMLTPDRIFAARDPRGFRPLVMGRIPAQAAHRADTIVFASETCAFDLIGADYEREVKPGELVIVGPEGVHSRFYCAAAAAVELRLRARLFLAARQHGVRPRGAADARRHGPPAGAGIAGRCRHRRAGARLGRDRGDGLLARERHSAAVRPDPQSLCRPHVH